MIVQQSGQIDVYKDALPVERLNTSTISSTTSSHPAAIILRLSILKEAKREGIEASSVWKTTGRERDLWLKQE